MADETYRQERRKPTSENISGQELLSRIHEIQSEAGVDAISPLQMEEKEPIKRVPGNEPGMTVRNVPPQLAGLFPSNNSSQPQEPRQSRPDPKVSNASHDHLAAYEKMQDLYARLSSKTHKYDTIHLPSSGKFYNGKDGPADGVVNMRAMTGEEEEILATARYVKNGVAIDKIFKNCIREQIDPSGLLVIDRDYLLIYLRSISFTTRYDVEIKCRDCDRAFSTAINLDLEVEYCPDDFGPENLVGTLPVSGFTYRCRLPIGRDEIEVTKYRERRVKDFGADVADDTLMYRTSLLIEELEGLTEKRQIQMLAKKLPIADLNHIENAIGSPPFGVNTDIPMICPTCYSEFSAKLSLDANFFFPRPNKGSTSRA